MKKLLIRAAAIFAVFAFAGFTAGWPLRSSQANATGPLKTSEASSKQAEKTPRNTVPVGQQPYGLAFDGKNIWAANFADFPGTVAKVRARDGKVLGTFNVGRKPIGVIFDGANIWVTNNLDNTVSKLRPTDGQALGTFNVQSPWWLASDGENIWVADFVEKSAVTKLRASDGKNLGTFLTGGTGGALAVACDKSSVWVTNFTGAGNGTVSKLRASDGQIIGVYEVGPNPLGVTLQDAYLWVANLGGASVSKLNASDGKLLGTFPVAPEPYGLAFDGEHIWATGAIALTELQASDGAIVAKYPIGNTAGLALDGKSIWVAETFHNRLQKLPLVKTAKK